MLRLLVYKYRSRYYLCMLGCCEHHQTKEDIFLTGEEVFTISHHQGSSSVETLRELLAEIDKHGILDIRIMEIYIDGHLPTTTGAHGRVH